MPDPKGQKLFVNLGASQTRRRVKGFGHGIRKVQTAGRGLAVIIHTATGQHLTELEALFADVGCSTTESYLTEIREPLPSLSCPLSELHTRKDRCAMPSDNNSHDHNNDNSFPTDE